MAADTPIHEVTALFEKVATMKQADTINVSGVHSTAIIDPTAKLAPDVEVGPYSIIGADVEIEAGTKIGPHVVINGPTTIGKNNKIYQFASIGEAPQHIGYKGEETRLEIGDENIIRECCTISRATTEADGVTRVGNKNFLMAYVHIAHDCQIGNETIFANSATLAGHVVVRDYAILSGFTCVRQFCQIGEYSFIAGASSVVKDIPPYILVSGHHASPYGLNSIGLKRRGFSEETVRTLKKAYQILYRQNNSLQEAIAQLEAMASDCKALIIFLNALKAAERGIVR